MQSRQFVLKAFQAFDKFVDHRVVQLIQFIIVSLKNDPAVIENKYAI